MAGLRSLATASGADAGYCLRSKESTKAVADGVPVLGGLANVARAVGCDAVALTSDDASRYDYLLKAAWVVLASRKLPSLRVRSR